MLQNTQKAVEAMDKDSKIVGEGQKVIDEAGKSFEALSRVSKEINEKSLMDIQNTANSTWEQLTAMNQVAVSVEDIDKIAVELLETVQRS